MKNVLAFLNATSTKVSVLFFISGFIFMTGVMWLAVLFGFAPIQLPIPSTVVVVGLVLLFLVGAFIWLAVEVTKTVFEDGEPSWGNILMVPVTWTWALVSDFVLIALYVGMIQALGAVW